MKKAISAIALVLVAFSFVSCASDPVPKKKDLPEWFLMPPQATDAIYGVGMAKMKDISKGREAAIADARKDIAFQVNVRVEAMINDYYQEAGEGNNTQAIQFYESVSKQVAQINLAGATVQNVEMADDGTMYALVAYPKNSMLDGVEDVFKRNESAAFAEFKADEARRRLEAEMDDNPPVSTNNVTE